MTKRAWGAAIQNREEKFELKRQALLLTAARIIRRGGFEKMSLGDIGAELNIAKPTVYYYFRNKEEIVRELIDSALASLLDTENFPDDFPGVTRVSGAERFARLVRRCVRVVSGDIGASLFVVYPYQLDPKIRQEIDTLVQPVLDMGEQILRDGMADGSIRPCDPAATFQFVLSSLRCIPLLLAAYKMPGQAVSDAAVTLILRGAATGV